MVERINAQTLAKSASYMFMAGVAQGCHGAAWLSTIKYFFGNRYIYRQPDEQSKRPFADEEYDI